MAITSKSPTDLRATSAPASDRDEILYLNERTQVFRRHLADGTGSLICKQPLGPKAAVRLRHERRMLERLARVKGVRQPIAAAPTDVIAFEDGDFISLAEAAKSKPFETPALLALALQLSEIVAAVHHVGVVHKDISPANILLDSSGMPLLIDFDLATTFAEERPGFIQPQEIAGTLAYIAPEQTGRTGRSVDQRADLYALGAVLYELTVGHPPFNDDRSDPLQLIHDILAQAPAVPAELDLRVPKALSDILLRLLEKEPDRRYQSAEGLKIDLLRLREMRARGESGTFPLGEHDYPLRLLPPSQLVGRTVEIGILQAAFDNALHGRGSGVLVSGAPGVGKSALINELRPIVTARRGWFVAGKFDQYRQDVGAGAMGQALHALIRLMLAEPEAELAVLRERVLQGLGPNAGLLAAMLPEFGASFGITAEVASGDPIQTAKRLARASLDLLRSLASPQRPLVLVIDDMQWSTATALDFIDAIITVSSLRGLLLLGSYRESEVDATHPLSVMLARWERLNVTPRQLRLNNLPPDDLASLLAEMLRLPPARARQLAEAVGARTDGNPFDTVELVIALRQDGVLIPGANGWHWEAATIRRHIGKGEVIDLLTARIARLPAPARALLESIACLGGEVELARLAAASDLSIAQAEEQLSPSLEDGLLVMEDSSGTVRFRHDRVQQAAYNGMSPAARNAGHLLLARRMATLPEFAATAAEQYLSALDAINETEERRRVVDLFHTAATNARQASNYLLAERCLTAALALLNTKAVVADSALSAALEIELHTVLYCLGRLDEADGVYASVARRCGDSLQLVDAACVQITSLTNRSRLGEAIALGLDLLHQLGVDKPQNMNAVVAERLDYLSAWAATLEATDDIGRAEIDDPRVLGLAKLFHKIMVPSVFCDTTLWTWLMLQSQHLWEEHGACAPLITCMNAAPVVLIGMRLDFRAAIAVARHVEAVGEARGYKAETAVVRCVFAGSVNHWFESLESNIGQAQLAREGLLQAGDFQYACFSYLGSIPDRFELAPTLADCVEETKAGLELAARTGNDNVAAAFLPYRQLVRALCGETHVKGSFDDDDFDEATHLERVGAGMAATYFHVVRACSAAIFGEAEGLYRHSAATMPLLAYTPGMYCVALAHLLHGLALADRIKTATAAERDGLLAEFDACRHWLAQRAADAPMNFLHLLKWIEAERAWAMGDERDTARAFDVALYEAASRPRPWHAALITERAGLFHLKHGLGHTGRMLLNQARHLYETWGAAAKAKAMTGTYDFLREASGLRRKGDSSHSSGHSGSISVDSVDLLGILRASQALSSETSFTLLRARMGKLLRGLTGATHLSGAMWYEDSQEWSVAPEGTAADSPIPVEEAGQRGLLPLSAFNYVVRTREPLLVGDALHDDRFARDPYFAGVECCSLLGVPIFNQGVLRIVLLLENRLSHGAFTADRLEAVNLIAGQLAVSTANALLYDSLERKVAQRTDDLKLANQRLEALSSTDPLTGLANRRRFNEMFEAEWQRAIRPQVPIGVAMIDIDQFKLYNDHYGHLGGDECLRRVARALDKSTRGGTDLVARYGGEEFVMVLPGADLDAVHSVAERARAAIEALQEPHEKSAHGIVTVSMGIGAMVPTQQSDPETLVELADAALYRAKKNGRNQVVGLKVDELPAPDEQLPEKQQVRPMPDKSKTVRAGTIGAATAQPLRLLMIEDSVADADLVLRELKRGFESVQFERVDTADALNAALGQQAWDIAVCDYHLPSFGALPALALVRQRPDYLPFIIVSGVIQEEIAVEAMKLGVDDYVLKSNLARLAPAIRRELATNERRRERAIVERELREHERRFIDTLDNMELASVMLDCDARITYCNDCLLRLTGWRQEEVIGQNWFEMFMPAELGNMKPLFMELLADSPNAWHQENEIYTRFHERRLIRWNNSLLRSGAGEVIGIASIGEDITERKKAENRVTHLNRVYAVLSGINTLIVRVRDRDELFREACRIAVELGQFASAYIAIVNPESKQFKIIASCNIDPPRLEQLQSILSVGVAEDAGFRDVVMNQRKPLVISNIGAEMPAKLKNILYRDDMQALCVLPLVPADQTTGILSLRAREAGFFDTEEIRLLVELAGDVSFALDHLDKAAKLDYLAYYDQLTGLANASLFRERLAQHLHGADNNRQFMALLLLDVERFKTVNDALGRPAGDALLQQLAGRLVKCIGNPDQVANLGADHFALILPDVGDADQVARMLENELYCVLDEPFLIADTDFKAAARIGIALYPGDGVDADSLFRNAEAALKKAKAGGERYLFYTQHMTERVAERLSLENKLRRALEREEFVLHYQPKVATETGRMTGVEALIRWNDPATGLVPPMQFIPLLEQTGLIKEVGAWALRRAVKDHSRWRELGLEAPRIAVNVSAIQLRQKDFVEGVRRILAEGATPPGIDLEITESLIMEDVAGTIGKLQAIRDMGLVIAIDDFGTGYSSLAYLAKLPAGTVKIDRSFIITMLQDSSTMTLVSTTISLAHSLGLKVVAEGVDQEEQAKVLRLLCCDEMQGYLFSKPVPFEEMSALIRRLSSG